MTRKRRKRKDTQPLMLNTGLVEVANPYYGPASPQEHRVIVAIRTLRDDPLGQMHDRHQVSEHQYRAGRQIQSDWELSGRDGRLKAQDTTQEPVDGGRAPSSRLGTTDAGMAASRRLDSYAGLLGAAGWQLLKLVLIDKRTLRECAQVMHVTASAANLKYVGRRFRECLDDVAVKMGLST